MKRQAEVNSARHGNRTSGESAARAKLDSSQCARKLGSPAGSIALLVLALAAGCAAQVPTAPPAHAIDRTEPTVGPDSGVLRLEWARATTPTRSSLTATTDLADLQAHCGVGDGALGDVALLLAAGQAAGRPPPDVEQFTLALRAAGSPHVWPRTWSLAGKLNRDEALERMLAWLASFDDGGERHCGIATSGEAGSSSEILVVVAVDAIAELNAAIPTRARSGLWVSVDATTLVESAGAKLIVLAPTGGPYAVPTAASDGRIRGRVRVDRAGMWKLQLLSTTETGPRPALEAVVWVDREPPNLAEQESAPGEERADPSRAADEQLFDMLAALRHAASLVPLVRSSELDALAQEHSESMMRARRVGHDVGYGNPTERVARALAGARRAGENVAHAANVVRAHRTLWASPSHRGNLVDPHFNTIGLGVARAPDGSLWVTQEFAEL